MTPTQLFGREGLKTHLALTQPGREKELLKKPHHDNHSHHTKVKVLGLTSPCGGQTSTRIKMKTG